MSDSTKTENTEDGPTGLPSRPPRTNEDTKGFWDATGEGRFQLQRCAACDTVIWWPRAVCPECSSFDLTEFDASGNGSVYSYTVVHRSVGGWNKVTPYVVAYVELEEGPRIMTNIIDCDPAAVAIDAPVRLVWNDTGEGSALPRFTLQ